MWFGHASIYYCWGKQKLAQKVHKFATWFSTTLMVGISQDFVWHTVKVDCCWSWVLMILVPSCRISLVFFLHFAPPQTVIRALKLQRHTRLPIIYLFFRWRGKIIVPNLFFQKVARLSKTCQNFPWIFPLATVFLRFGTSEDCDLDFEFLGLQEGQVKALFPMKNRRQNNLGSEQLEVLEMHLARKIWVDYFWYMQYSSWPLVGNEGMNPQYTNVKVDSLIPY